MNKEDMGLSPDLPGEVWNIDEEINEEKSALVMANHFPDKPALMPTDKICVKCKAPAFYYSDAGRREISISGVCEPCFDELFKEPPEDLKGDTLPFLPQQEGDDWEPMHMGFGGG